MLFVRFTDDEYYLIWDSNTIPLKTIKLFDDASSKPIFDMKNNFHHEYFDTITRILPNTRKMMNKSFVTEHMIVKTQYMLELLNEVENNSGLIGSNFQEKVMNTTNIEYLPKLCQEKNGRVFHVFLHW
ncbi:MAG: hypothetical protein IJR85_10915 [Synergistaceae bacterium]|nr:hypothetical protein [Synergistaceae bacterium]